MRLAIPARPLWAKTAQCGRSPAITALLLCSLASAAGAQTPPGPPSAAPGFSHEARQRLMGMDASAEAARQRLLEQAELDLSQGRTELAQAGLDRAAMLLHAPDTESALVRTYMQAGEYRRALAFAAHAAGAHRREWPAGMALYAWLLQIGGQSLVAQRMLDTARADAPAQPELIDVAQRLTSSWPRPEGVLLEGWLRLAPYALGATPPPGVQVVGTAVLLPSGQTAVVPAALVDGAERLWLRNGQGRTVLASPEGAVDAQGLQRLRLQEALPKPAAPMARRAPFAGSPGYLLEYADGPSQPAWPLLRQGFFGRAQAAGGLRPLGLDLPAGPRGGPVFDAQGQWVGLALRGADGSDRLVDVALLSQDTEAAPVAQATPAVVPRLSADEVYERGLSQALQVLRLASPSPQRATLSP